MSDSKRTKRQRANTKVSLKELIQNKKKEL